MASDFYSGKLTAQDTTPTAIYQFEVASLFWAYLGINYFQTQDMLVGEILELLPVAQEKRLQQRREGMPKLEA